MKRILSKAAYGLIYLALLCPSCDKPESGQDTDQEGHGGKPLEQIVTGDVSDITEFSAVIKSSANPTPEMGEVLLGVLISESEEITMDNSKNAMSRELDTKNQFSVNVNSLKPQTQYYYKSYIRYGGLYHFGEVKSFSTLQLESAVETGEVTDITETSATFHGRLTSLPKGKATIAVLFIISPGQPGEEGYYESSRVHEASLKEDGTFSLTVNAFSPGETFYCVARAEINGIVINGETVSFTTSGTPPVTGPKENTTWKIAYNGRVDKDGGRVEEIVITDVPSNQKYIVSVISLAQYVTFGGDIMDYLNYELEHNSDYVYQGSPQTIYLNPVRHGTWYAFIIGLDKDKKLTGEFAFNSFDVAEESESAEYKFWIGDWTVSDGTVSYNLQISHIENNQVYRIDGWEVRRNAPSGWTQMDQEYLEAFFEPSNGRLYFQSQYICTYTDQDLNGEMVDELFLGQIYYNGIQEGEGYYIIPQEGIDLAYAEKTADNKGTLQPCNIETNVGADLFQGKICRMQYLYQEIKSGGFHFYNDPNKFKDLLSFTNGNLIMVKTDSNSPVPASISRCGFGTTDGKPLRGKVYQPREDRILKAIRQ
jgi:hypothetical protein